MFLALVIFLLTVGVGLFVTYPLLDQSRASQVVDPSDVESLMLRRDQIFHDIRELEFDRQVGKLSAADYEELLAQLKADAAAVLERLEQANGAEKAAKRGRSETGSRRARPSPDRNVEARIATARQRLEDARRPVACPSCGASNPREARFCMGCGAALAAGTKGEA